MAFPATTIAASSQLATRMLARLSDLVHALRQRPLSLGYALAISLSNVIMAIIPDHAQLAIVGAASTNITHLSSDPLFVLPASAFIDVDNGWLWVPLTLTLLGGLETRLGWRRVLVTVFAAHVAASLISEGLLLARMAWHVVPQSAASMLDVGPSYVLLAAVTGALLIGSWRLRVAAVLFGALIIPSSLEGISRLDMSAVGHVCAMAIGGLLTLAYGAVTRREALADAEFETLERVSQLAPRALQPRAA